jgi:transposase
MHLLRQILLLKQQGKSIRDIARSLAIARNTIRGYLRLLPQTDLTGLLAQTDDQLNLLIQPPPISPPVGSRLAELQKRLPAIDRQLACTGVTRYDLWLDYRGEQPKGYQYTQFCYHYRQWHQTQQVTMHFEHKAGDKVFVDFAGKRLSLVDQASGELKPVEFFIAVLGCSQLTYAQAVASQRTEDFIEALQNALRYFGGVPAAIVPDNLKAAVIRADRYEPQINEMLSDFALHYQTTILPARSGKPRDKALAEGAVNILYNRVYAPLRNRVFHQLDELNAAILERVDAHNQMLFSGKEYSRRTRFEAYEQAQLRSLPTSIYQIKHHLVARVQKNCHVLLSEDKHYYSVPYRYVGKRVRLIYTQNTVEIYAHYERIATHQRDRSTYHYSTTKDHLPSTQQWVSDWNPASFIRWAGRIGPQTQCAVEAILNSRAHPEQAYKSCQGILSLEKKVGIDRLERACERALCYQSVSYKVIRAILERGLDSLPESTPALITTTHENIRGATAYQ